MMETDYTHLKMLEEGNSCIFNLNLIGLIEFSLVLINPISKDTLSFTFWLQMIGILFAILQMKFNLKLKNFSIEMTWLTLKNPFWKITKKNALKMLLIGHLNKLKDFPLIYILLMLVHTNMLSMMDKTEKLLVDLEYILMKIFNSILKYKRDTSSLIMSKQSNSMKPFSRLHLLGKNMILSFVKNIQLVLWNSQVVSLILIDSFSKLLSQHQIKSP